MAHLSELDSPALLVFPQRVKENIAEALRMAGGPERLRPHVKTHKSPDVARWMMEAGIQKFKCATIAEAEMLGMCEAKDVLLAYQPVGPKLRRFIALVQQYQGTSYSCLTDHPSAAREMSEAFAASGLNVPLFIDLNVGQNRTGIAPEYAFDLYAECAHLNGVRPVGLQAYDGHIRGSDFGQRERDCHAAFAPVEALRERIIEAGFPAPTIVAGGSPSFPIHAQRAGVECSPGTFVYWDKGYADLCPEQPFQPAALLLTRVISLPDATKICLDLGHKSVAAENPIGQRVFFPAAPSLVPLSQSEEHLVLEAGAHHGWQPGDVLLGTPYHICPTVALYERAYLMEDRKLSGEMRIIARDRKISC